MMKNEQTAEMNKIIRKMKGLMRRIGRLHYTGKFDKALKYIEQEEQLIKHFQGDVPEEIKVLHILWLWTRATIYSFRGNLALTLKDAKELLMVGQLYDHKGGISIGTHELAWYYWPFRG